MVLDFVDVKTLFFQKIPTGLRGGMCGQTATWDNGKVCHFMEFLGFLGVDSYPIEQSYSIRSVYKTPIVEAGL